MARPKPTTTVDVLPPEGASTATMAVLPNVAVLTLSAEQIAAAIKADIDQHERASRQAAFIALRVGLRLVWIRDNSMYGSLAQFTKAHFGGKAERTLFRYIRLADDFLHDAGLLDKSTHRLTGKALEKAAPIVTEQLELFTDPKAKLEGAIKKLVKWVGDRGLAELYKALEAKAPAKPPRTGKGGGGNAPLTIEQLAALGVGELMGPGGLLSIYQAGNWKHMDDDHLALLSSTLDAWHIAAGEIAEARKKAAAKTTR